MKENNAFTTTQYTSSICHAVVISLRQTKVNENYELRSEGKSLLLQDLGIFKTINESVIKFKLLAISMNVERNPGPEFTKVICGSFSQGNNLKGELQRENKLISYERAFKMPENDMYIAGIGQAILELLSFKVGSGNHQRGISLLQKFSDIFGNMRLVPLKMTSHLTSHNFQILKIEIFSKPCKI